MRKELLERVAEKKEELKNRATGTEKQIEVARSELEQLESENSNFPAKIKRADSLNSEKELICPDCFIEEGARIPLTPVPSDTEEDNFKCKKCGFEISLSA
jgi:hypothetical protein